MLKCVYIFNLHPPNLVLHLEYWNIFGVLITFIELTGALFQNQKEEEKNEPSY